MTKSGELGMKFKRAVLVPPFFRDKGTTELAQRRLEGGSSGVSEALQEILEFNIQSQFFDPDSDELRIDTLELIKFTPTEFEIQLSFKNADFVSQSLTEPDIVEVKIKRSDIFIDAETYEPLDPDFVMYVRLPPQVPVDEADSLDLLDDIVKETMRTFSAIFVCGTFFFGHGAIYMWNLVTFSQFLVVINQWKVNITPHAKLVLDHLDMLAYLEFIETSWFVDWVQDYT
jgi:hypothetical protein